MSVDGGCIRGLFALALAVGSCGTSRDSASGTAGASGTGVAGSGGMTGTGATTGVSGSNGTGGTGPIHIPSGIGGFNVGICGQPPVNCGPSFCGNGKIDTCTVTAWGGTGGMGNPDCVATVTEVCDGTLGVPVTCETLGYGSGTTACASDCTVAAHCVDCAAHPQIAACADAPFAATPWMVAIAASSNEIGIAWSGGPGDAPLSFARLSPALELLSVTSIQDASFPKSSFSDVRVAPLPSGWAIAATAVSGLRLYALDAAGNNLGATMPETVVSGTTPPVSSVVLAPRAGGGPLIVWRSSGLRAAVVAADGLSTTPPVSLPLSGTSPSAATAGGAFHVMAIERGGPQMLGQPRLVRIETDGTVGAAATIGDVVFPLMDVAQEAALLVPGGDDLGLVYKGPLAGGGASAGFMFQKISTGGASVGGPVLLANVTDHVAVAGADALGADTVAVLSGPNGKTLSAVRVGASGQIATPLFKVMSTPDALYQHLGRQRVARIGSDVVALWYTQSGIRIARLTP